MTNFASKTSINWNTTVWTHSYKMDLSHKILKIFQDSTSNGSSNMQLHILDTQIYGIETHFKWNITTCTYSNKVWLCQNTLEVETCAGERGLRDHPPEHSKYFRIPGYIFLKYRIIFYFYDSFSPKKKLSYAFAQKYRDVTPSGSSNIIY